MTRKAIGAAVIAAACMGGCGKGDPAINANRITIAVIPKGTTHEFWKSIHAGALQAAKELDVDVIWKGPLKEDDREGQVEVVEDMTRRGVKGIVLAPLDDTALVAPVAAAVKAGVPVVVIDSGLKGGGFASFVATDNLKGGALAGDHLAKLLKGRGKVLMLRYQEGSASTAQREQGFLNAIRRHPGITVASANQYGGATTESAYRASENLLAPYKQGGTLSVKGVFCPNESTTFGMLRALEDAGLAGKVKFVGFDASAKLVEGLRAGRINGLVVQNPVRMGSLGVRTIVAKLRGEMVPARVDTGVQLVTELNMEDPGVKEALFPDLTILK